MPQHSKRARQHVLSIRLQVAPAIVVEPLAGLEADPPFVHVALDDLGSRIALATDGVGEVPARVIENIVAAIVDELDDADRGKSQSKAKTSGLVDLLRGGNAF